MIKKINVHTDPFGLKMLRTKCVPVLGTTDDIREHVNDLAETCAADPNCVALSSNQIWDNVIEPPPAIFVVKTIDSTCYPFLNPKLIKTFNKTEILNEGCMSIPGRGCVVERPRHIVVSFLEAEGNSIVEQHLYYMHARIWLHEYDHLQGKIITDYERNKI